MKSAKLFRRLVAGGAIAILAACVIAVLAPLEPLLDVIGWLFAGGFLAIMLGGAGQWWLKPRP